MTDDRCDLWVVAGCLFEVSLPAAVTVWRWANPGPDVTILSDLRRGDRQHVRFRAEAAGVGERDGAVELRFVNDGFPERRITVRIAPEESTPS